MIIPLTEEHHPSQIQSVMDLMEKFEMNDMIYCDVGACIGELLQYYSQFMSSGYAFEPNKGNYDFLKENYSDKKVIIENVAVSSSCGTMDFLSTDNVGDHCSRNKKWADATTESSEYTVKSIPCITLDSYFEDKEVDFIKIDVEGEEWEVLYGAKKLMQNRNIIFQVEFHSHDNWNHRDFIYENGYEIYSLKLEKYDRDCTRPYQAFLIKDM